MRTLSVTGTGNITAKPDQITVSLRMDTRAPGYQEAVNKAALTLEELQISIGRIGLSKDHLKTDSWNVNGEYTSEQDGNGNYRPVFSGYLVSHEISLRFELDQERLAQVLNCITDHISEPQINIAFGLKDPSVTEDEALRKAAQAARHKAELLAETSGCKLGNLVSIEYHSTDRNGISPTRFHIPSGLMKAQSEAARMDLVPEDLTVSDTVTFVFELTGSV